MIPQQAPPLAFETSGNLPPNVLAHQSGTVPDEQLQLLHEDLLLQARYAGQYVAYRDIWKPGGGASILEREVIANNSDAREMQRQLEARLRELGIAADDVEQQFVEHPDAAAERSTVEG